MSIPSLTHPAADHFSPRARASGFINAAYMTPKPLASLEAQQGILERYERPDFAKEAFFDTPERVRVLIAKLVGGPSTQISLAGAASYGLATLAWNLRNQAQELVGSRRTILGVDGQFPSNVQPWRRLEHCGFQFELVPGGVGASERLLKRIDDDTALVAVTPLAWTDGLRLDVPAISSRAKAAGALFAMDVTQSIGADGPLPEEVNCDVVVGACYKWMLGPYGTGFMRLSSQLQEQLEPLEANWKNFANSDDFNTLNEYQEEYMSPAASFDHGESSAFVRMAGLESALETLIKIGPEQVQSHGRAFGMALAQNLNTDRFEISDVESPGQAAHLFRVGPKDRSLFAPLSAALSDAGVSVSQRNGGWRLSPHVYNDASDVQRILDVLK